MLKLLQKMIHLIVFSLTLLYLFGDSSGVVKVESVYVVNGDSVTLEIQRDGDIDWKFGPQNILIAEISSAPYKITLYEDALDGSFKGRLKLDKTGSLTINNTRTTDSGDYEVINTCTEMPLVKFKLTVHAPLPIPVISTLTQHPTTSSVSSCVLLCSVENVSTVEHQDNSIYSCVVNNTISNQTTHLDINTVWQTCKENLGEGTLGPLVVLISAAPAAAAAVGSLLIISAVGIFCWKRRKTDQEDITYAEPMSCKRPAHESKCSEEDQVLYASVKTRR